MIPFGSFRRLRRVMGPSWLVDPETESGKIGYALDFVKDAFVQRVFVGLLARFPETAPADGLAALGRDRRVVRGLEEGDASYAERLIRWLDDRKRAGNPFALLQKLAEYLGPVPSFRTVDNRGNWYSRAADGTESALLNQANWNWDEDAARWSRFWLVIYPNGLYTEGQEWNEPETQDWGEGTNVTWGSTAPADVVSTVRFLVADWKPLHARCVNIILAFDPDSFDPTAAIDDAGMPAGLWGRWSKNVAGVQVPARLDTARYWEGV